ncbi:peptidoglycan-recognition protein LF [Drosophila grimshawi]|uniref:peptidoglycan-recognition protein LF n=1 Tax=Drosophila grimshawi TaxID=7222 RepID=UPI001C934451|nr:peptidoglycan-recognition protein LF [Drosophila grimshawi]
MKIHQSTQSTVRNEDQAANTNVRRLSGLIWTCSILLVLVATTAAYFVWMMTQNDNPANRALRILDRSEWMGEPPSAFRLLPIPVQNVIIHHTATEGCDTEEVCIYRMRMIQSFHMDSLNYTDIAYHFLIGGDGQVYVGRGWHGQGQHLKGYGAVSLGIAFIGTFVNVAPPPLQVRAFKLLMDEGVRLHKLHADYHIYAHRQLRTTESPGQKLFEMMKHWPRWSADVTSLRSLNKEPLRFVPRSSWLAQPPQYNMPDLELPVKSVRFESTSSEPCSTQASCVLRVRSLQTEHIENLNRQDINYNFVVGGDGNVYVGRGWDYSCETPPTDERQFNGLIVGFVGLSKHTSSQMNVSQQLLAQGIKLGKLVPDYQLIDKSK